MKKRRMFPILAPHVKANDCLPSEVGTERKKGTLLRKEKTLPGFRPGFLSRFIPGQHLSDRITAAFAEGEVGRGWKTGGIAHTHTHTEKRTYSFYI